MPRPSDKDIAESLDCANVELVKPFGEPEPWEDEAVDDYLYPDLNDEHDFMEGERLYPLD